MLKGVKLIYIYYTVKNENNLFIMFSKRIIRSSSKFRFIENAKYLVWDNCLYFGNFIPIDGTSDYEYYKITV